MKYRGYFAGAAAIALSFAQMAEAGTVANGKWTPTGCGDAPKPITIDLSSDAAFSKSLDASDAYEQKSQTYQDCLFKEAGADNQAIVAAQKAAQDERAATLKQNDADIKTGLDKYGKSKK